MTFVVVKEKTFKYPVKIYEPENGRKIMRQVEFIFLTVSPDEVAGLLRDAREAKRNEEEASFDRTLCERVVRGWKEGDIKDEDGKLFEFSEDALSTLIDFPYVRKVLVETYFDAINGGAKKGN